MISCLMRKSNPIEEALAELKKAHEAKDLAAIDPAMEKLNSVFQAAAQEMYQQGGDANAESQNNTDESNSGSADEEVTDVDFEEVSEDDKKK